MSEKILPTKDSNKVPKKSWWANLFERLEKAGKEVQKNACRH